MTASSLRNFLSLFSSVFQIRPTHEFVTSVGHSDPRGAHRAPADLDDGFQLWFLNDLRFPQLANLGIRIAVN
jgi:hypothetical protein